MAFKKGRKGPKSRFNRFNHNHDSGFSRLNANSGKGTLHSQGFEMDTSVLWVICTNTATNWIGAAMVLLQQFTNSGRHNIWTAAHNLIAVVFPG